jgi:hypothetical protein
VVDPTLKRPVDMPWGTLAWCRVSGGIEGTWFIGELIQTRTGCLVRTYTEEKGSVPPAFTSTALTDIDAELTALRMATLPANNDPKRGRLAELEVVVGDRVVRIPFQRPTSSSKFNQASPIDRLYRAIFGWPS